LPTMLHLLNGAFVSAKCIPKCDHTPLWCIGALIRYQLASSATQICVGRFIPLPMRSIENTRPLSRASSRYNHRRSSVIIIRPCQPRSTRIRGIPVSAAFTSLRAGARPHRAQEQPIRRLEFSINSAARQRSLRTATPVREP
jgi:hypothetical protein